MDLASKQPPGGPDCAARHDPVKQVGQATTPPITVIQNWKPSPDLTTAAIMAAVASATIGSYFPAAFHSSALVCAAAEVCTLI
jgi:hypothetical protein